MAYSTQQKKIFFAHEVNTNARGRSPVADVLVLKHAVALDGVVKLGEGGVEQVVHLLRKRRLELRLVIGYVSIMKG